MYTNTPWDNHYHGTDPWIMTDPTKPRHILQKYISPFVNPIILTFGVIGNFSGHAVELIKGNEKFTLFKITWPL